MHDNLDLFVVEEVSKSEIISTRVDMVLETKLDFKLIKTTGHCNTMLGKFLIVLDILVTTISTDTLASIGTLNL